MTDAEKIAFAVGWYEAGQCPGCFTPLPEVDCAGDRHTLEGEAFQYGHGLQQPKGELCPWGPDDLYSLCLIGSGVVRYDRGSAGTNRPASGETAPSRENRPDPGCFVDLPLSGRGPT